MVLLVLLSLLLSSLPTALYAQDDAFNTQQQEQTDAAAANLPPPIIAAAELRAFYQRYRPNHLDRIDTILFRYKDKETDIIPDLHGKYQSEPPLIALVFIVDHLPGVANAIGKDALLDGLDFMWATLPACAVALLVATAVKCVAKWMRAPRKAETYDEPIPSTVPTTSDRELATRSTSLLVPVTAFAAGMFFALVLCFVLRNNAMLAAVLMERGMASIA